MKTILVAAAALLVAMGCKAQFSPEINSTDLKSQIGYLASDALMGRKPGTLGDKAAEKYILRAMKKAGLKPLCDKGKQSFEIIAEVKAGEGNAMWLNGNSLSFGKDFAPLSFSSNATAQAPVAFVGFGFDIDNDSIHWNDYQGVEAKGKWVVILRGDPEPDKANSGFLAFAQERAKAVTARDKGAIGVLFVAPEDVEKEDNVQAMQFDKSPADAGIPVFSITRKLADQLLGNKPINELAASIRKNHAPAPFITASNLKAVSDVKQVKVTSANIIGLLEGINPRLKDEYIVVGAHFDHLGMGGEGSGSRRPDTLAVHNGADDNASGTAGVLELADYFAHLEQKTDRSLIFVCFTGEEMGLLGSKEFVKHPPIPLKSIKAMVNLDMVGRLNPDNRSIIVGGTGTSAQSDSLITQLEKKRGFSVNHSPDGYGPSDHASFYSENIPVFYFTTGAHDQYHTPDDDANLINYEGEVSLLNMVGNLVRTLGNADTQLDFRESGSKQEARYGRAFKVTLGIVPDMVSTANDGLGVDGVKKGGPADRAGIKKGDKIVALDGQKVTNIYDYMSRLGKLKLGQLSTVEIMRNGEKQVLLVQF